MISLKSKLKSVKGITLISLVITIIILLILAGITIAQLTGKGLFSRTLEAKEKNNKQAATETINLKITNIQISSYVENKELPTLQYLADKLCEDNDMEYVLTASKEQASLDKIDVGNVSSIYTKLKDYSYEFEINSSLQLASIDGVKIADNNSDGTITLTQNQYNSILNRLSALENNLNNTTTNENYSTEEQVVGTWINGKNIYRMVVEFPSTISLTSNSWTVITISNLNAEKIVSCNMIGASNGMTIPIACQAINDGISVLNERNASYSASGIILEYTKTTNN